MKYPLINEDYRPEAVVLASGDYPRHPVPLHLLDNAPYLCCCDGAAVELLEHAITPQAIVGDGDSLPAFFREHYTGIVHIYSEQEDNDLTKATRFCMAKGYQRIAYLGATGKREDHTIGNIFLLPRYVQQFGITPEIYTDNGWFSVINGTAELPSFPGQQVSIFNITGKKVEGEGFTWPPYTYNELWQGTLNEAKSNRILLRTDGIMIVFRTYLAKKT
jgi:thiamine pyrophosphokinase